MKMVEAEEAPKKTLTLGSKLSLKKNVDTDQVRQSFSHGRSKAVTVEVKKRRLAQPSPTIVEAPPSSEPPKVEVKESTIIPQEQRLTRVEQEARKTALEQAKKFKKEEETTVQEAEEESFDDELRADDFITPITEPSRVNTKIAPLRKDYEENEEEEGPKNNRVLVKRPPTVSTKKETHQPRRLSRQSINIALNDEAAERMRSLASLRRSRQKHKQGRQDINDKVPRVIREVVISDFITIEELANRMAVRAAELIKALLKLGVIVTINQTIDGDTAELVCSEFGHKVKRVLESDIELGLKGAEDFPQDLAPRAPVVTVMGHVDHGKTSLLDALRRTDVVTQEAGGITQHIGAYQVHLKRGAKITFIDTPGHAAFTAMRARGAHVTDIVVLVVAADDGIMEQTIEAIHHAQAAKVPIVVAINKIDKPEANSSRVRSELLGHGIVLEEFGGEVLAVEISAKTGFNLDKLEEAILLQAEMLNLRANPHRAAEANIIEAKVDRGRGVVATVLVHRGTLKLGDTFVAGKEYGRVRALINDRGEKITEADPSTPVEILGFDGLPGAGDEFFVVADEAKAREIASYRQHREREAKASALVRGSMEQLMNRIAVGEARELPIIIKTDVQGSLEAIISSLSKLATDEVSVRVLHGGVGAINEGDVNLANASGGLIVGFNVRANPQSLELIRRAKLEVRYYSIIYDVVDDIKGLMGGLLTPTTHEQRLGTAEVRQVFNVTKVGKVAGCYVLEGVVRRGASVRLLRDNVVIYEGSLRTLRRFKEEVREVKDSYECGMALANYDDIKVGDTLECFEVEMQARSL